ncbi:ABC-2 family transporter protein [Acidiferrobacter sp. SPIII_3]|jgi:ABC-2 type transport system permease protein|uniref:ABC transporter permease n=1 Tax=Acidiferrobacter sp. SPIII_3 TaxID=1281578 RepID=UPI00143D5555|nr:ABC-2 family transporter protein [Acidiferrobacter sp. SPIII_3]
MASYGALVRAAFLDGMARRRTALFAFLGNLAWLVIPYSIWREAYSSVHRVGGFDWGQMRTYLVWSFLINGLLTFRVETQLFNRVRTGEILMELIRPIDLQKGRLAMVVGGILADGLFSIPSMLVLAGIFLRPLAPVSVEAGAAFGVSVVLGFVVKFLISYLTAAVSLWTENIVGLVWLRNAVTDVLSGAVVPLVLLPPALATVAAWSPFEAIVYIPLSVYLGHVAPLSALAAQAAWVVVLWLLARAVWSVGLTRLTVLGG